MVFLGHTLGPAGFCLTVHAEPWTSIPSHPPGTAWHLSAPVLCTHLKILVDFGVQGQPGTWLCPGGGQRVHLSLPECVAQTGAARELFFPVLGRSFLQTLHWERSGWMFKVILG